MLWRSNWRDSGPQGGPAQKGHHQQGRNKGSSEALHGNRLHCTVEDLVFVPIKIVKNKSMWARLEIERQFINENNLLDDGLNLNLLNKYSESSLV